MPELEVVLPQMTPVSHGAAVLCGVRKPSGYPSEVLNTLCIEKHDPDLASVVREVAFITLCWFSLVPRPHPLTRRNGLVNQVEFLGLAHAFVTM